jgi:uncharacterized membrane-anchored protein
MSNILSKAGVLLATLGGCAAALAHPGHTTLSPAAHALAHGEAVWPVVLLGLAVPALLLGLAWWRVQRSRT